MPMNIVIVAGTLATAERIETRTGTPLCKFTVAFTAKGYQGAADREHRIPFTAFKDNATGVLAARIGSRVLVKGRAEEDRWKGQDGTEKSFLKLIAEHVEVIEAAPAAVPPPPPPEPAREEPATRDDLDSVPF